MTEKPFSPAKSHLNSVSVLKGALASIIADPDCCEASKAIARDALRQIRDAKADNASDMEQSQVYRDAPSQVDLELLEVAEAVASVDFLGREENYADEDFVMVSVGTVRKARAAIAKTKGDTQ